ncbi:MAG: DsrE family protein [Candidatus Hermodarchaeota archaeon]
MVKSIIIICEESPIGKNSVVESIRMAAGILAVGDVENCKVILLRDSIYFLNKHLNPKAVNMDEFTDIIRLIELSNLEIYVHDEALRIAGLNPADLILLDNVKIVDNKKISQLILEADMSFKY